MMSAKRNSFQVSVKLKTAAVMMPGRAAGTTISHSTRPREAPSTMADSSISIGTASMNPFIIQTAYGNTTDMLISTSALRVSSMPSCLNIRK